jgi:hypothetical protein
MGSDEAGMEADSARAAIEPNAEAALDATFEAEWAAAEAARMSAGPPMEPETGPIAEPDAVPESRIETAPEPPESEAPPSANAAAAVHESEAPLLVLGDDGADELEQATAGWQRPMAERAAAAAPPDAGPAPNARWNARLAAVAAEEGWDEADVAAVRAYLAEVPYPAAAGTPEPEVSPAVPPTIPDAAPQPVTTGELPGSDFTLPGAEALDQALSALAIPAPEPTDLPPTPAMEEAAWPTPATPATDRAWSKPEPGAEPIDAEPAAPTPATPDAQAPSWPARDTTIVSRPGSVTGFGERTLGPDDPMAEPEWLRGRRDAAARAYRRLRRIFPTNER